MLESAEISPPNECPICKNNTFSEFNRRANAQCSRCGARERQRYFWMVMKKLEVFQRNMRILHFAPERSIGKILFKRYGPTYHPVDFQPELFFGRYEVKKFDCCNDLKDVPDSSYDLIIHNHILEHLPCNVMDVLTHMKRVLSPTGWHFCSVPITGKSPTTLEDLGDLTPQERRARFGQGDHFRIFGYDDFAREVDLRFGMKKIPSDALFSSEELKRAGVPDLQKRSMKANGHSIFVMRHAHLPEAIQ